VLDTVVRPAFIESDRAALIEQNRHRRQQVVLAVGAAIMAGLGGLQALVPDQRWPGLIHVVLGDDPSSSPDGERGSSNLGC
jgi:hypothetical protein